MQTDILIMGLLSIYDAVAAVLFLVVMFKFYKVKTTCRKIGVVVLMLGVAYQSLQSGMFAATGEMPLYTEFPLWMLKDIGASILAVGYWLDYRQRGDQP